MLCYGSVDLAVSAGAYLANGLLVCDCVGGCGALVAGLELVADEGRAQSLDHEIMVVQGCDNDGGLGAVERSGDVRSRHFGVGVVFAVNGDGIDVDGAVVAVGKCCLADLMTFDAHEGAYYIPQLLTSF